MKTAAPWAAKARAAAAPMPYGEFAPVIRVTLPSSPVSNIASLSLGPYQSHSLGRFGGARVPSGCRLPPSPKVGVHCDSDMTVVFPCRMHGTFLAKGMLLAFLLAYGIISPWRMGLRSPHLASV